jgi:hypothetical protein
VDQLLVNGDAGGRRIPAVSEKRRLHAQRTYFVESYLVNRLGSDTGRKMLLYYFQDLRDSEACGAKYLDFRRRFQFYRLSGKKGIRRLISRLLHVNF